MQVFTIYFKFIPTHSMKPLMHYRNMTCSRVVSYYIAVVANDSCEFIFGSVFNVCLPCYVFDNKTNWYFLINVKIFILLTLPVAHILFIFNFIIILFIFLYFFRTYAKSQQLFMYIFQYFKVGKYFFHTRSVYTHPYRFSL